jgi:hypothetical protein
MCSCSGSCNCNSTTIPRGPAGPIGPQGIQGVAGFTGSNGVDGANGLNSFTTLTNLFYQPQNVNGLANSFVTIDVVDSTWAAINQIIYISYNTSNIGGFYRVISKPSSVTLYITRLSWTIPGISFVSPGGTVLNNSSIVPSGTKGTDGTSGTNGLPGTNGVNAFTTLQTSFTQPPVNTNIGIVVANNTWIGIGQILYISSPLLGVGGFYQVVSKTGTNNMTVTRLDWTIPTITFIVANGSNQVGAGSTVSASGPKGADGDTDVLSYLEDAFWGLVDAAGITAKTLRSITIPAGTLTEDDDVLECQTIYRTDAMAPPNLGNAYYIKITNANALSDIIGPVVATTTYFPEEGIAPFMYIYMNYKIQRTSLTTFRCKSEIFCSVDAVYSGLVTMQVAASYLNLSVANIALNGSSDWTNTQYVAAIADDPSDKISLIHHEVKVVKKSV